MCFCTGETRLTYDIAQRDEWGLTSGFRAPRHEKHRVSTPINVSTTPAYFTSMSCCTKFHSRGRSKSSTLTQKSLSNALLSVVVPVDPEILVVAIPSGNQIVSTKLLRSLQVLFVHYPLASIGMGVPPMTMLLSLCEMSLFSSI